MLVLSRQRDETIMIGDEIEISIVDIRGDKVRLGITAPSKIAVHRKEVYQAIRAENEQAAQIQGNDLSLPPSAGIAPGPARSRITGARVLATPPGTPVAARLSPRPLVPATSIPPMGAGHPKAARS
jgi:carbon storage regulator